MAIMNAYYPMLATIQMWHIILLLAVVLLLFGGKKLPELAKGLAKGMRIFRDELHGVQKDMESPTDLEDPQPDDNKANVQEKK